MEQSPPHYLVVIAGPTAVGKTDLAIQLAGHYNSVIISADSRQFYRELSIGTAKPTENQLKEVPHHFINNKSVTELYGAGHYEKEVITRLTDLFKIYSTVFLVGGSGLYIDAVLNGVDDFIEVPVHIRETINAQLQLKGLPWLQNELQTHDPGYYSSVDRNNSQRLIRALEVYTHTGLPYSSFLNKQKSNRDFIPIKILINTERELLYNRINQRVDDMMKQGLLDEATAFADQKNLNALKTVGYKELYDHLAGLYNLDTAVDKIKQHTRNYAKRQLTWFKNKDTFKEFKPQDLESIIRYIDASTTQNL